MTATVPDWMVTPPPVCCTPLVMLSPISCTTPDGPGLMFITRRRLDHGMPIHEFRPVLHCASSTTEPGTTASRTTLLVMLSSALRA